MESKKTHDLRTIFGTTLVFTVLPSFLAYALLGFEVALILAICLSTTFIVTGIVGVENVVTSQLSEFHQKIKGYLTDMYAEMLKDKGN